MFQLTKEQQNDLYRRKVALGEVPGKMTGYASIDKPWLKYYSEEVISGKLPNQTIYGYLKENNKNYIDDTAIIYFSRKISYGELFKNIDACERALIAVGVKEHDIVTIALPSIPEALYAVYALNKIGAVANMIHPLAGLKETISYINEVRSEVVILFDETYKMVASKLHTTKVRKCIVVSAVESLSSVFKLLYYIKSKYKKQKYDKGTMCWSEFIKGGINISVPNIKKNPETLALISHTGGTTGDPKGVMLSDKNINALIWEIGCNILHTRQERYMSVLPPFINYSLINSMLEPLAFGFTVILIPKYEPLKFDRYIKKYQPNYISSIPDYWEACLEIKKLQTMKLSCLKGVYYGGEALNAKKEEEINALLLACGVQHGLKKGLGATELVSAATITYDGCNDINSVGVPLVKIDCKIVNQDTHEELIYNQEGEICFSGDTLMLGYFEKPDATDDVIKIHADGKRWLHTGDLGYINEEGLVFISGRIKRILTTKGTDGNPTKMFPDRIEKVIMQHNEISLCCVIGIPDKDRVNVGKAIIVLNAGVEKTEPIKEEVIAICREELPTYMVPAYVEFRDTLPRTERGKVDYRKLEEECAQK
ncbi:MAG: class I adenylate-forming enzyme family protein [Lachnospiraceae bacterium]